jgi:hypothetical protein
MASEAVMTIACGNRVCKVAETGRCVEGLALDACPHYGHEPEGELPPVSEFADEETFGGGEVLPPAVTLTPAEASAVLRQGDSRVVAILGPSDAGKTSLISSLYDLFQEGSVAGHEFARSRTLHAFEHTCHDARATSRRGVPHTNRTPRGEVSFYHLEVGSQSTGKLVSLLLGDRAGEEYRDAADDVSIVVNFSEVSRADTLTILVDGERLLDAGARHNVRSDIVMLLQGLQDGDGLKAASRLALVLTKLDAVRRAEHMGRALRDFESLVADITQLFGEAFEHIAPFKVAASPKTDAVSRGTGVSELLTFWLSSSRRPLTPAIEQPELDRAFAQLRVLDEPDEANDG